MLGLGAPAALADDGQRLVMVEHSPAMIEALEQKGFDVGFVGEKTEAAVYLTVAQEAKLRAEGYRIGEVLEDARTHQARLAEISATKNREALAAEFARSGLPRAGVERNGKKVVTVPGDTVIQRAYTFSNYAGRFLYVEAHNKLHTDTQGPAMSMSYAGPDGVFRPSVNLSNSTISPDGGDAQIGGNKIADGDAGAGARYMYHRGLIALRGDDANLQASEITVRVSAVAFQGNAASSDTATPIEWTGEALPPRVANFQKDFITKYLDPTETYSRMDQLVAQFPDIIEAIELPNKTNGYQRPGMATMAGTTNPNANPTGNNQALAVLLFSRAMGHQGGNDITARFVNPSAPNSPLSVSVTDGTWIDYDQNDADQSDRINKITVPTKDITVSLATNDSGALISTAAEVVAAINADPAASALVQAFTYAGNAGAGIVPATPARTNAVPTGVTGTLPSCDTSETAPCSFSDTRVRLSDYLRGGTAYWTGNGAANPLALTRVDARHVQKGPFTQKVYRIGKDRTNNAVGVFLYCQQHAREWVTPITCLETAERLVRNYAIDPTTKEYVDNLNVFILPSVNPDGGHASFYDNAGQRKNMVMNLTTTGGYCPINTANGGIGNRNNWGVDLNRNNTVGSLFDGYAGGSTSCTSEVYSGPEEASEPEIRNEHWVQETFKGIKFANNIHTHGGYFMWAPGAYRTAGRVTLPAPNIGVENYFFKVSETILSHIKSSRGTAILPQRTGPIADVLYSAAGNSADEAYYKRGIIAYSFEAGAQRIQVNPTTGAITRTSVGFQPCFQNAQPPAGFSSTSCGTPQNPNPLLANEGHDSTMEFAEGNFGLIHGALEYLHDNTAPQTNIEYSAAQTNGDPIHFKFNWVTEPSVIFYTTDGTDPVIVPDDPATEIDERCFNSSSTKCYQGQGPRRPGEVLTLSTPGAYTVKWTSVDLKGNQEPIKSQRLLVAADDELSSPSAQVPATLSLSLGTAASFGPFTPGVEQTYDAGTTANVVSTAGDGLLSVSDPSPTNTGKLVNGSFSLAQPLQARASSGAGTGGEFAPVGGSANPTSLLTYSGPTSNDAVTLNFRQAIGRTEGLRTGTYSKTLTFTLSTTQP
ncbi:MAG TPA: M14 family zinc carboxypeptidase [Solirubrobacter sp.]|nr:M14 family zinc carboxypeptidase [Solirubrobacter sp.]